MPKVNGLTLKQQKWLEIYLETGNATKAARQAYICNERSARQIGYENMTKLDISEHLEALGMNLVQLFKAIIDGVDATKLIKARLIVQKDNGNITNNELIEAAKELNGVYMEIPDYSVRHRYLLTILRLRGLYPRTKSKPEYKEETAMIKWIAPRQTASL